MRAIAYAFAILLAAASVARADESSCLDCHSDAHPGFPKSGHALAAVEPWYTKSLRVTPESLKPLCASCHAPESERPRAGVTCESCHVSGGVVLVPKERKLEAPHPVRFAPELRDGSLCARCHVVDLPLGPGGAPIRLQDTVAEHAAWRAKTGDRRGCVDCHAGSAPAHFAGMRDPAMLASAVALKVEPAKSPAGEVAGTVVLENRTGHAFPTGSGMREAWIRVALTAPGAAPVEVLARALAVRGDPAAGETPIDDRLAPAGTLRIPFNVRVPEGFPSAGRALEARVELALVSLDFPDSHPLVPSGEPRVRPVTSARAPLPKED